MTPKTPGTVGRADAMLRVIAAILALASLRLVVGLDPGWYFSGILAAYLVVGYALTTAAARADPAYMMTRVSTENWHPLSGLHVPGTRPRAH